MGEHLFRIILVCVLRVSARDVRTRAADPGPRVTRLRHSPVARVALHDAPPGPFRLFRHAFGFRPVCVSAFPGGRALPRRGDPIGDWFGAVDVRSGALGGLTDASTAYIDPANTAAPRAARAYTARYTAASTPRPRAPGCAARRHTTATRTSWLVAVKPTLDILEGLGLASSTLKDPASRTHRAHLTSCRAHLTFAWRGIQGRFHKHNDHRLSSSCGRSRGPRCASQMQPHAATAHQHAIGFCIASSCAAACLTCMPIRFALARVVNTSYSFERRSVAALLPVSCSCLIMFSASSASR